MATQPDDNTTPQPVMWLAVNPKALTIDGLLFRCPICRCLVIDIDREPHLEALHACTADLVLLEKVAEQHAAA